MRSLAEAAVSQPVWSRLTALLTRLLHADDSAEAGSAAEHSPPQLSLSPAYSGTPKWSQRRWALLSPVLSLACLVCVVLAVVFLSRAASSLSSCLLSSDAAAAPQPGAAVRSSRVLVLMSDNRVLHADINSSLSLAVYVNYQYTRLHPGYRFLYLQSGISLDSVPRHRRPNAERADSKDAVSCYNAPLDQYRAASWCKLQSAYWVLSEPEADWDFVWFMDSDAVISNYLMPVEWWLRASKTLEPGCSGVAFLAPHSACSVLLMSNAPNQPHTANGGQWLLKRNNASLRMLSQWWHQSLPDKNFAHAYEQDALAVCLAAMRGSERYKYTGLLLEPSLQVQTSLQLTRHIGHARAQQRAPYFTELMTRMQQDSAFASMETDFHSVLAQVQQTAVSSIDTGLDRVPWPPGWRPPPLHANSRSNMDSAVQQSRRE